MNAIKHAKALKSLNTFLQACGVAVDITGMHMTASQTVGGRTQLHARIGVHSKKFKRAIVKAGWQRIESFSVGGGDRESLYTHPDLVGHISLHTHGSDGDYTDKIYLMN